MKNYKIAEKELMDRVNDFTTKKTEPERECASLQAWIDTHSLTLKKYLELEEMGFGLKEQKFLWTKIMEIGVANRIKFRSSGAKIYERCRTVGRQDSDLNHSYIV